MPPDISYFQLCWQGVQRLCPPLSTDISCFPDLSRAPYVLYGVKYIDLVSLAAKGPFHPVIVHDRSQPWAYGYFLFSYHISVYMRWFRFTCVFFHTNTVNDWKCCSNDEMVEMMGSRCPRRRGGDAVQPNRICPCRPRCGRGWTHRRACGDVPELYERESVRRTVLQLVWVQGPLARPACPRLPTLCP